MNHISTRETHTRALKRCKWIEKSRNLVKQFLNENNFLVTTSENAEDALKKIEIKVPLVIRLAGTNVEKGNKILRDSKLNYIEANTLEDAANKAVAALKK